jgi:cytoskeletal protein RodZ
MAKGNFGERLKREREMREVTMDELSKSTRISNRFLQALENEDWERLPGGVFGHGFVRAIARYLGLDEESLLGEYDLARAEKLPPPAEKPEERIPSPPKWLPAAVVFALLLTVIGVFYAARYTFHRIAAHSAAKPPTASTASSPAPSEPSPASASGPASAEATADPAPAALLQLSISTSAATHVRVLGDSKVLLDAELPAGETRRFSAKEHFEITAADSSAVLLEMNGRAMPPVGPPGTSGRIVLTKDNLR